MKITTETYIDEWYLEHRDEDERWYPFEIQVYLKNDAARNRFLILNQDPTVDSTGYRPAFLVHPDIDQWLQDNIGPGQRGGALPRETNYQVRLPGQKWWHDWSYAHDPYHCHYITFHFRYIEDLIAFKLGCL